MDRICRFVPLLLLVCLLAACSGKAVPQGADASEALSRVRVTGGQKVHVAVSGGDSALNEDLASMLTAYIQSERGLDPVDRAEGAGVRIRVCIEDVFPLGSSNAPVSAGQTLAGATTGTVLGALLGGSIGEGRHGTAWGAGAGLLVGLGTVFLDSQGSCKLWGMRALVGIRNDGRTPGDDDMRPLTVRAEGKDMDRAAILPALEDRLCMEIVNALQPS
ncbi:MAG: glycine zipper family protein [Desulfovibrio sp.]|nr:glycine zipper family protein [Desulfovibrio sp.]